MGVSDPADNRSCHTAFRPAAGGRALLLEGSSGNRLERATTLPARKDSSEEWRMVTIIYEFIQYK